MMNGATAEKLRLAGLKVLVIDDSKTIRRTAETLLVKEGCEVFTAIDGFDALSKIADHQPVQDRTHQQRFLALLVRSSQLERLFRVYPNYKEGLDHGRT